MHMHANSTTRTKLVIGLSTLGAASMSAVSALQLGLVRNLPDPPLRGFDSKKVNLSSTAFPLGVPDGVLSLASFVANVPLAMWAGRDRALERPWVSIAFATKAVGEALVATWYFTQMPRREKAWCGYCIAGAVATWGIAALAVTEAARAVKTILHRRRVKMEGAVVHRPGSKHAMQLDGTAALARA